MLKLKRLRIPLIPCACLVLLLTLCALWSRTLSRQDLLGFFTPAGHLRAMATDRQGLMLFSTNVPFDPAMGLSAKAMSAPAGDVDELHEYLFASTFEKWKLAGFHLTNGTIGTWPWKFDGLFVPYWVLLIPLAIPPMVAARQFLVRFRRRRSGQCLVCGYDLRQSPVRCPECGTPINGDLDSATDDSSAPGSARRKFAIKRFIKLSAAAALIGCGCALLWRGREAARRTDMARAEKAAGMHRHVSEFRFRGRLVDAIQSLQRQTGTTIRLDSSALGLGGTPVDIHLFDLELGPALRGLLEEATGGSSDALEACPINGAILVGAPQSLPLYVRVYEVSDLLNSADAKFEAAALGQPGSAIWSLLQRQSLQNLVAHFIRPDSWRYAPGGTADEMAWANLMAVYQTPTAQAEIQGLLDVARGKTLNAPHGPPAEVANLDKPMVDLAFNGTPTDAIDALRDLSRTNIVVPTGGLFHDEGYVHMRVRNTTVGRALQALFIDALGPAQWQFVARDRTIGVVADPALTNLSLREYDIRDIIADAIAFENASSNPSTPSMPHATYSPFNGSRPPPTPMGQSEAVTALTNLIVDSIDTNSWRDNGGTVYGPFEFNGRLLIEQTDAVHRQIAALLNELRSPGAPNKSPVVLAASGGFVSDVAKDFAYPPTSIQELNVHSTFAQAIEALQQMTHTNIVVYWADLAAAGVRPDTPVRVHLWDTNPEAALGVLISLAGGEDKVSYKITNSAFIVASTERLKSPTRTSTRLYDIRDLIDQLLAYDKSKNPPSGAAGSTPPMTVDDAVGSLDRLIEDTILPDSWKDNGGNFGSLREFDGRLIITQTPEAHRRLVALLHALRASGVKDGLDLSTFVPTTQPAK